MCICKNEYIAVHVWRQSWAITVAGKLSHADGSAEVEVDLNSIELNDRKQGCPVRIGSQQYQFVRLNLFKHTFAHF